ncbi:hypothetical protein V1498_21155 [Peribacillus sp. SCS-26]|uniref:hypothetical protein n=1 Tax=Paraperibacillus marinus TaxID=3115295 RepID=UPI003905AE48
MRKEKNRTQTGGLQHELEAIRMCADSESRCTILPFKKRPGVPDKIKMLLCEAGSYTPGPIFIKDQKIWVTCYISPGQFEMAERELHVQKLTEKLTRKLANYEFIVRLIER